MRVKLDIGYGFVIYFVRSLYVYSAGNANGNLIGSVPESLLLIIFYGTALLLAGLGHVLFRRLSLPLLWFNGMVWLLFIGLSFVAITAVFSSYVYGMPYHHCPFCILKPEYCFIGFFIYGTMLPAGFFGISAALTSLIPARLGLNEVVHRFQRWAVLLSSILMVLFLLLVSYHFVVYRFVGGEG